ncbi:MAG TPA: hypothetical protein VLE91_01275 [Candidatus Saccharimonadales bacterium]|nr:hypothetical protein [Candidatus Saccharimonadales bacterium]
MIEQRKVVLVEPPSSWVVEGFDVSSTATSYRKLSMTHAYVYMTVLDGLSRNDGVIPDVSQTLDVLPALLRNYYQRGWEQLRHELVFNGEILKRFKGREIEELLLKSGDLPKEVVNDVLGSANRIRFFQPTPGIGVFSVSSNYYDYLRENKVVPKDSAGVFHERGYDPSFIVMDETQPDADDILKHEISHFMVNVLQWHSFPQRRNKTRELNSPFADFQDELVCYLASDIDPTIRSYHAFGDPLDRQSVIWVENTLKFASDCINYSKQRGIDPSIYIYSTMVSRNFTDLMQRFSRVTQWSM